MHEVPRAAYVKSIRGKSQLRRKANKDRILKKNTAKGRNWFEGGRVEEWKIAGSSECGRVHGA